MALLVVLVLVFVVAGSSASFIWFMNQQQARAGARYRSAAAMSAAEAGVYRVLSILEAVTPDRSSSGQVWRPGTLSETLPVGTFEGRFTVSVADDVDGAVLITSAGEVAGITRRLRARVYLASPALLTALYGASLVRFDRPPASMVILPYGAGVGDRPWIHIAVGRGIVFASTDVSINDSSAMVGADPGPADAPEGSRSATRLPIPGPVRLLLARGAELTMGPEPLRVDVQQLRVMGVRIEGAVLRAEGLPVLPDVNRIYFQALARRNTANAALNEAAGKYVGDEDLALKADSLYAQEQFERLQVYLQSGLQPARFQGVLYVKGPVAVPDGQQITIADGALITEGLLRLGQGAGLRVTHTAATRTLPGIIVLDGALLVTRQARLLAHGLVYVDRVIDLWAGSHLDVVGAVMGNDRGLSFRNLGATVLIRYDPAVLGTPGLRTPAGAPLLAWVAAWEELP